MRRCFLAASLNRKPKDSSTEKASTQPPMRCPAHGFELFRVGRRLRAVQFIEASGCHRHRPMNSQALRIGWLELGCFVEFPVRHCARPARNKRVSAPAHLVQVSWLPFVRLFAFLPCLVKVACNPRLPKQTPFAAQAAGSKGRLQCRAPVTAICWKASLCPEQLAGSTLA